MIFKVQIMKRLKSSVYIAYLHSNPTLLTSGLLTALCVGFKQGDKGKILF